VRRMDDGDRSSTQKRRPCAANADRPLTRAVTELFEDKTRGGPAHLKVTVASVLTFAPRGERRRNTGRPAMMKSAGCRMQRWRRRAARLPGTGARANDEKNRGRCRSGTAGWRLPSPRWGERRLHHVVLSRTTFGARAVGPSASCSSQLFAERRRWQGRIFRVIHLIREGPKHCRDRRPARVR